MIQLDMFRNVFESRPPPEHEPPQTFDLILTDPPWDYDGRTFLNKKANETGAASDHYPTMTPKELKEMNVQHLCNKNCIMYMWTTGPQLDVSIEVLQAWGFKYKTVAFVWDKITTNPGYYTMSSIEYCIVGTKNAIPKPRGSRNERQFLQRKRTHHSSKPLDFIERISNMHPEQTKLEMFSRKAYKGWYSWGHDANGEGSVNIPRLNNKDIPDHVANVSWPLPF
jgi:N6-adenosine-specific RNA methylase IME4